MPEKPLVPYKALKQKQKARIADWMNRETLQFFLQYQRMPESEEFETLCQTVYAKVRGANSRVAYEEIRQLYAKRLAHPAGCRSWDYFGISHQAAKAEESSKTSPKAEKEKA